MFDMFNWWKKKCTNIPKVYSEPDPNAVPVLLLLDVSGSMSGGAICSLNTAVRQMLDSFVAERTYGRAVHVAVIIFGERIEVKYEFMPAWELKKKWVDLSADGGTPLGGALNVAKSLLEDPARNPVTCYSPLAVLVSDGYPTDTWVESMNAFIDSGRSSRCNRLAMAIGEYADEEMLRHFLRGTGNNLQYANDAQGIKDFFNLVAATTAGLVMGD